MASFNATGNTLIADIDTFSSNYTISIHDGVILCNSPSADITITLPNASIAQGSIFTIKKIDNGGYKTIISPPGGSTIDNQSNLIITAQYNAATLISDGSNYWII